MSAEAGFDVAPNSGSTLRKMLQLNLAPYMSTFETISTGATKEYSLEKAMIKMYNDWEGVEFGHSYYKGELCRRRRRRRRRCCCCSCSCR